MIGGRDDAIVIAFVRSAESNKEVESRLSLRNALYAGTCFLLQQARISAKVQLPKRERFYRRSFLKSRDAASVDPAKKKVRGKTRKTSR